MIKKILVEKPFLPLSFTIAVVLLIALYKKQYSADLQLYDIYFVIPVPLLAGLFTLILVTASLIYWFMRKRKLVMQLTAVHVFGTIGIVIYLMCFLGSPPDSKIALGYSLSIAEYQKLRQLNNQFALGILLLALIQLLLVIHILIILFVKPKKVI